MRHVALRTTCLAALVLATAPTFASAAAPARTVRLISGGSLPVNAAGVGMSADGSRAFFSTAEALLPADTNGVTDVYGRDLDGTLQLISTGTGAATSGFNGVSANGDRAWYTTTNADVAGDTDTNFDIYERRRDGTLRQISAGNAASAAIFVQASDDGDHVLFWTPEAIPGTGDSDGTANDFYDRRGDNSIRLVTVGTSVSVVYFSNRNVLSHDGERAEFFTTESLVAGDGDIVTDQYTVSTTTGAYTLLTPGTATSTSGSPDRTGRRLWWSTTEALVGADTDTAYDVYESTDGALRLISGGTANVDAFQETALEANGSVYFSTREKLLPEDADAAGGDIYERRADDSLRLISGGPGDATSASLGVGPDGSVTFQTDAALTPADTDVESDMYLRRPDGSLLFLTPGTPGFLSLSYFTPSVPVDRARTVFGTNLALVPADTNGVSDAYEVTDEGVRLLAVGVPGGTGMNFSQSADGSRLLFTTTSTIPGTGDGDTATDVYEAAFAVPDVAGTPSLTGTGKVGSVHACTAPAITGEAVTTTYAWLRDAAVLAGATAATYKPVLADAGHSLRCRVTARNSVGADVVDSAPRAFVPVALAARLAGFPIVGTTLKCTTFAGAATTTYRWKRGTRAVRGRTARTYKVAKADLGKRLTCAATGRTGALATAVAQALSIPKQCVVPGVRGLTPAAAQTRLGNAGCRSKVSKVKGSGVAKGLALGTSPAKKAKRANGERITIKVRK